MDAPTDEALLQEHLAGKTGSFELLVRRHARELHQFVLRFTGDSTTAEDVVQESFLQVHSSADRFDPKRKFKPWLFTIAANKARDLLRKRTRRREVAFDARMNEDDDASGRFIHLLASDEGLPEEELAIEQQRRAVKAVVEEMPDNLREVLILGYYHRFPYKQIAQILGVPLGTVKSRLHAAVGWFGDRYRAEVAAREQREQRDA